MSIKTANGPAAFAQGQSTIDQELAFIGQPLTLTSQASALGFVLANTGYMMGADLRGASQVKLVGRVQTVSSSAGTPRLILRYSPTFTTTPANFLPMGNASADVAISLFTGADTAMADSGWIDIVADATLATRPSGCVLALLSQGGDGAQSPIVSYVTAYFR